jgi:hypothetical protein
MGTQLQFVFDPEKLKFMKSVLASVDQKAIIRELVELYVEFIQIEKREGSKYGKSHS